MQTFDLPDEDDSTEGAPDCIEHGVDYMFEDGKSLMFYYNYLDYSWQLGDLKVSARVYLDNSQEVSFFGEGLSVARLDDPVFKPIVRYLKRRYRVIKVFGVAGTYETAFSRR
jgi:hypothetical protein